MRYWTPYVVVGLLALLAVIAVPLLWMGMENEPDTYTPNDTISLPAPDTTGEVTVEQAIAQRRSVRTFRDETPNIKQLSQLLWSAQGITSEQGDKRAAPSAGMTYPLEVYVAIGPKMQHLKAGVYHYLPEEHALRQLATGDVRSILTSAALGQQHINQAPMSVVITADYSRTTSRYGKKGRRYVHMEAGHAAQNMYLQAEALNLGMVVTGAFDEGEVQEVLHSPAEHEPLYIIPVGFPA